MNVLSTIQNVDATINILKSKYCESLLYAQKELNEVFDLLSDKESKYLYQQELTFCILKNFLNGDKASTFSGLMGDKHFKSLIEKVISENFFPEMVCPESQKSHDIMNYCKVTTFLLEQYRYKDYVKISNGDVCLDIGACLGDTSIYMKQCGAKQVYAFEIDNINIVCMKKTFAKLNIADTISIVNYAISKDNDTVYYTPSINNLGGGSICREKNNESYPVKSITIDSFCEQNNVCPTFIKMDIEGAELDAISGARNTLLQYKPKVAICIYHKWSHRWEIPLALKKILPDHKFYIKKSHPRCETVLLGTP